MELKLFLFFLFQFPYSINRYSDLSCFWMQITKSTKSTTSYFELCWNVVLRCLNRPYTLTTLTTSSKSFFFLPFFIKSFKYQQVFFLFYIYLFYINENNNRTKISICWCYNSYIKFTLSKITTKAFSDQF